MEGVFIKRKRKNNYSFRFLLINNDKYWFFIGSDIMIYRFIDIIKIMLLFYLFIFVKMFVVCFVGKKWL